MFEKLTCVKEKACLNFRNRMKGFFQFSIILFTKFRSFEINKDFTFFKHSLVYY